MTGVLFAVLGGSIGDTVTLFDVVIQDMRPAPTTATATLTFNTNGKQQKTENVTTSDTGDYVIPNARATAYEVMVHQETGPALTSGTLDSYVACSTSPTWTYQTAGVNKRGTFTASIRLVGTTTVLDTTLTGGIDMEVEAI